MPSIRIEGERSITKEYVENNSAISKMLHERSVRPEALPLAEDVKKLRCKLDGDIRKIEKAAKKGKS